MTPTHLHILAQLGEDSVIGAEPVYGRDGLSGVVLSDGNSFFFASDSDPESWGEFVGELVMKHKRIAVWDLRRFGFWAFDDDLIIWDVKSLNGGEIGIQELSRSLSRDDNVYARFIELDQRVIAHSRAAKTARLDVDARLITPTSLLVEWAKSKVSVIRALYIAGLDKFYDEYASRWPFIRALRDSELSGIHVDVSFITATLAGDVDTVTHRTLCSMRDLQVGGLVSTFLNPIGGKTGRLRHEGGFNSLGIPHGPARNAITSRYEGGKIVSLDFNAIDYRCIVKAIGGEVAKLYDGAADFHQRTASFIFKDVTPSNRDSIKYLSYIYIYGGSDNTLVEKTGWDLENVRRVLELLDKKIGPVKEFREKLWIQAQRDGFVTTPGGRMVKCEDDDSSGKVIGLFAQSYSSWVFERAFKRLNDRLRMHLRSCIAFSVHDEVVMDCHPNDFDVLQDLVKLMESDGYVVKMKIGDSYGSFD